MGAHLWKWVSPLLLATTAAASVIAYPRLPADVRLDLGQLLPFAIEPPPEPAPRLVVVLLMPVLATLVWIAMRWAATPSAQRLARGMLPAAPEEVTAPDRFRHFEKAYDQVVAAVVLLLAGLHAAVLVGAFAQPLPAARLATAALGLFLVISGAAIPALEANWVAGARTSRTLNDPKIWKVTHRALGWSFAISGIATLAMAWAAPPYGIVSGVGLMLLSCILSVAVSSRSA